MAGKIFTPDFMGALLGQIYYLPPTLELAETMSQPLACLLIDEVEELRGVYSHFLLWRRKWAGMAWVLEAR